MHEIFKMKKLNIRYPEKGSGLAALSVLMVSATMSSPAHANGLAKKQIIAGGTASGGALTLKPQWPSPITGAAKPVLPSLPRGLSSPNVGGKFNQGSGGGKASPSSPLVSTRSMASISSQLTDALQAANVISQPRATSGGALLAPIPKGQTVVSPRPGAGLTLAARPQAVGVVSPIAHAAPTSGGSGGQWVQQTSGGRSPTTIWVWVPSSSRNGPTKSVQGSGMNDGETSSPGPGRGEGEDLAPAQSVGMPTVMNPNGPDMTPSQMLSNGWFTSNTVLSVTTAPDPNTTANMSANSPGPGDGPAADSSAGGVADGSGTGNASAGAGTGDGGSW